MRIAFIVDEFPRESHRYIVDQVVGMLERGHEVTVYATTKPRDDDVARTEYNLSGRAIYTPIPTDRRERVFRSRRLLIEGLRQSPLSVVRACNPLRFGLDALSLRPLYRLVPMLGESFDIVHAHFGPKARIAAILKQIGVPGSLVATFHGIGVRQARKDSKRYERLFTVGDRFFANSMYTYRELVALGVDEDKLVHHPNSIETSRFPFRWSDSIDSVPDPLRLVTVARLEKVKGIKYGIRAVARLRDDIDVTVEYHVAGGGSRRSALESLAFELGVDDAVTFYGHQHRDDVISLLSNSHLFVFPSIEEAFGMVLLEAQAVGLPIVASDVGGIPEVVKEEITAKLAPARDPKAIAAAVEEWMDVAETWPSVGADGREFVEVNFGTDDLNDKLQMIYKNTILTNDRRY